MRWPFERNAMTIPWWLHRTLIIVSMVTGAALGAIAALYLAHDLGRAAVVVFPLSFLLGAGLPYVIFRTWIHARCPVDGERMLIERLRLPPRYEQEVGRSATRYRCPVCGVTR